LNSKDPQIRRYGLGTVVSLSSPIDRSRKEFYIKRLIQSFQRFPRRDNFQTVVTIIVLWILKFTRKTVKYQLFGPLMSDILDLVLAISQKFRFDFGIAPGEVVSFIREECGLYPAAWRSLVTCDSVLWRRIALSSTPEASASVIVTATEMIGRINYPRELRSEAFVWLCQVKINDRFGRAADQIDPLAIDPDDDRSRQAVGL
jgi:hypothetical protein